MHTYSSTFSKILLTLGLLSPAQAQSDTIRHSTQGKAIDLVERSDTPSNLFIGNWRPTDEQKDALRPLAEKLTQENNGRRVEIGSLGGYEGGIILTAGKNIYYLFPKEGGWDVTELPLEARKKTRRGAVDYLKGGKEGQDD